MADPYVASLVRINAWGAGATAATVGSSSTAATAIPSGAKKLLIKASQKCHIKFGASTLTAATVNEYPLTADVDYVVDIPAGVTHYTAIRGGSSDATLSITDASS